MPPQTAESFRLDGRTAVITGAGSGIGRAIARRFAASGAAVVVLDLNAKSAEAVVAEIAAAGGIAVAFSCDVTSQTNVKAVFEQITAKRPVHILVNNAGISHVGTLETTTEPDFDKVFQVNVKGFYRVGIQ